MEGNYLSSKECAKIRELVASSNQKSLQSLLGFPSKKSKIDDNANFNIFPSTPKASALLKILGKKLAGGEFVENADTGKSFSLDVDDILQALLMVDPVYITPWKALVDFASALPNDSVPTISLLQCVSSIEDFLCNAQYPFASSKSNSEEKFPDTVLELMVEFTEKLRDFLFLSEQLQSLDERKDPVVTQVSIQLLLTVLITCKERWSGAFNDIVETAFLRCPSSDRMKLWLQLVQRSIPLLTQTQIEEIGSILLDVICDESTILSSAQDPASIVSIALEIAHTLGSAPIPDIDSNATTAKLWRRISFVGVYQTLARYKHELYLEAEKRLIEGIKKWNANTLGAWISEIMDTSSQSSDKSAIPDWFAVNLVSICVEVFTGNEAPSNLRHIANVISTDDYAKEIASSLTHDECKSILNFLEGKENISGPQFQKITQFVLLERPEEQDHDKIFYSSGGIFYVENNDTELFDCLSRWGTKILESLCLEDAHESRGFVKKKHSSALTRAIRLVNMVDQIIASSPDELISTARAFSSIIKTVAYFELPGCRTFLERKIEKGLSKPSAIQSIYFSTLRMITYSALKKDSDNEMARRWFGIIQRNIPASHSKYVHLLRSILPDGRSGILRISKTFIEPLYSSWGAGEYENQTVEEKSEPKMQKRIIDGLQGLLELIRAEQWGKIENDAWMTLSDLIVDDPPLPLDHRQWLLKTLISFVCNDYFHFEVADRILRATTTRISSFFLEYEDDSKILASPKEIEEIKLLHRLIAILLQYFGTKDELENYHIHLAQGREVLLRAILLYKKGQLVGNQFHHIISKQYHSVANRGSSSFFPCWFVFLKINLYLLDHIMSKGSKMKTFGHLENSSMNYKISLEHLVSNIKQMERLTLINDGSIDESDGWILPIWPQSEMTGDLTSTFPCLDLLLEFLFLVPLPAPESLDLDNPLSWKVITASGFLLKQQGISEKTKDPVLSIETIRKTAGRFLSTSSFLFRSAIDTDCGISALDELLTPIVSYCSALRLALEANEFADCGKIVGSLWNLYQAVASEKASVKIVKYLEAHLSESRDEAAKQDHRGFFFLTSISTESEIDETVRKLRLSCLRPFLSCLSFLTSLPEEEIWNMGESSSLTRSLTGGILGALVTDLRAGLEGHSGGIPRTLYIQYCMCIEECGSLLNELRDVDFDSSVLNLFREVTATLSDILVEIPLRDAVLFRTTFILAVAIFPSMSRDLVRRCLCDADDEKPPETVGNVLLADSVLFDDVLNDSIDILTRWAALRDPCSIPWLDIAGIDHSEEKDDTAPLREDRQQAPNTFYSDEEADREIPRVVHVPSPPRSRHKSSSSRRKNPRKIRLCTKELWSWTLSCSLLGLEQNWLESERTIQELHAVSSPASLAEWKTFFVRRTVDWRYFFGARTSRLQKSLIQINLLFRASQGLQQNPSGNHTILDMMAMNLPSAPRLRFCCLIECVSRVLLLSIRTFCSFLREEIRNFERDLSVFESVSCLMAWLTVDEAPEKDFSVGVFRLLGIVSRKSPPGEVLSTSKKEDKAELFERVSIVSSEVHKLYLELKELQKVLRDRGVDSFVAKELFGSFLEGRRHGSISSELLRCLGLKLHALEQVIPNEFKTTSLPDFPSSGLEGLDKKRGTSNTRKAAKRPKKRKVQSTGRKNRNKVVDIFMNLDQGTDGARRNSTKDAYADLEDFLVEG